MKNKLNFFGLVTFVALIAFSIAVCGADDGSTGIGNNVSNIGDFAFRGNSTSPPRVTIGENVQMNSGQSVFGLNSFASFYINNGRKAGIYTCIDSGRYGSGNWTFAGR